MLYKDSNTFSNTICVLKKLATISFVPSLTTAKVFQNDIQNRFLQYIAVAKAFIKKEKNLNKRKHTKLHRKKKHEDT